MNPPEKPAFDSDHGHVAGGLTGPGNYSGGMDSGFVGVSNTVYYGPISYNFSAYGPIGPYVQGSFSGLLLNDNNATDQEQITGTFNILRNN